MSAPSRKRIGAALLAAALPLAGIALAQTIDGLDLHAAARRSSEGERDADALAREVERSSATLAAQAIRDDAMRTVAAGQASLAGKPGRFAGTSPGPVDFDAIVAAAGNNASAETSAPRIIVFASLSMPPASLRPLIRDTARAGGSVVFNGFPGNSMKAFQEGILAAVEKTPNYASIGVDPRLFRAFAVRAVPTFVVVTTDFEPCEGLRCETQVPPHDRMAGNVTLAHALETFAAGGGPGAAIAAHALSRLARPLR